MEVGRLCNDVAAEQDAVLFFLGPLIDTDWDRPTPAEGWTIRDQVSHLAYFDDMTRLAVSDPAAFETLRDKAMEDLSAFVSAALEPGHQRTSAELIQWWIQERARMLVAFRNASQSSRVPWFGPAMSVASAATARLMETWAHGQDIVDALGVDRPATTRLRHICELGVRTFGHSFRSHGLEPPATPVRVELLGPSGQPWAWGPDDPTELVRGHALDLCLVVTQRRHVADTALHVEGPAAGTWMQLAQAFAGPPGQGRERRPDEPG